jgi:hypothetical protein
MGRTEIPGQSEETVRDTLSSKITRAKWSGVIAQMVEHLLYKS